MKMFFPSKSTSTWANLAKTGLQSALLWLVTLFCIPWAICSAEDYFSLPRYSSTWQAPLAVSFFILFALLNGWSGFSMATLGAGTPLPLDCANRLVVSGPYAYVRNPMAISGLGLGFSVALFLGSWLVALYVFSGLLLWNYVVRPIEEKDLLDRFGPAFRHYVDLVRCWIPRLSAYQRPR